jgi:hypothetical protein
MKFQTTLIEPIADRFEHRLRVPLAPAVDDRVVGIALELPPGNVRRIQSSNASCTNKLASSGRMTPPCDVPFVCCSSVAVPAPKHSLTS